MNQSLNTNGKHITSGLYRSFSFSLSLFLFCLSIFLSLSLSVCFFFSFFLSLSLGYVSSPRTVYDIHPRGKVQVYFTLSFVPCVIYTLAIKAFYCQMGREQWNIYLY
ncbi:hypothetical protein V8G54_016517 [Vigna mungo]|uniref:Uncharacterized protein n=1 Tax=Vigna mungo TaxID=3915 RepID=A0AAQ3RZE7_VIGMU